MLRETRNWTADEIQYLTNHYGRESMQAIMEHLDRSYDSVRRRAERLGLKDRRKVHDPIPQPDGTYHIPLFNRLKTVVRYVIVDADDIDKVKGYRWFAHTNPKAPTYARTFINGVSTFMHNLIMPPPPGKKVDHKNRNGLDNRRQNLRHGTDIQNAGNTGRRGDSWRGRPLRSRFKGVMFDKRHPDQPWYAVFRRKYLGGFAVEEDAARAYDKAAKEAYGEFAYLNFPEEK